MRFSDVTTVLLTVLSVIPKYLQFNDLCFCSTYSVVLCFLHLSCYYLIITPHIIRSIFIESSCDSNKQSLYTKITVQNKIWKVSNREKIGCREAQRQNWRLVLCLPFLVTDFKVQVLFKKITGLS